MQLKGQTVLVTGGLGFIGSHFVKALLGAPGSDAGDGAGAVGEDGRVVNVDLGTYAAHPGNVATVANDPRYRQVEADIADREAVRRVVAETRPRLIVNIAAESHVDRSVMDATPFVDTNVRGVQVLLDVCLHHDVPRLLQVSTDEVYGDVEGETGTTPESTPLRPSSPYAATKASADHLCQAYRRTHDAPVTLARPSNNYGPNQHPEKLIPLTIRRLLSGETMPLYGDGRQQRDWLFVEDCVRGLLAVIEEGDSQGTYNLAAGRPRENWTVVRALCERVAEATGQPLTRLTGLVEHVEDRPGHDRRYAPDASRARTELGWCPQVALEDGLDRTVRWYREHDRWIEAALDEDYSHYEEALYGDGWAGRATP